MMTHLTTLIELNAAECAVLREARQRAWRVKRVAKALEIGPETLRQWERGLRRPTWSKFERWCAVLGVSEIDLRLAK